MASGHQETNIFANYFDSNIFYLKFTACWYDDDANWKIRFFQLFYNTIWALYTYVLFFPSETMYLAQVYDDMDAFVRQLRDNGNHIALMYKVINFYFMRRKITHLMATLTNGEFSYEDHDDFHPKEIVRKNKKEALIYAYLFWFFVNICCVAMFVSSITVFVFKYENQYDVLENGEKFYRQKLPCHAVSPIGHGTRLQYFLNFVYSLGGVTLFAWIIVAMDSLFTSFMSCIAAHLIILQGAFKTLRPRCLRKLNMPLDEILHDPPELSEQLYHEQNKCIQHLQLIYGIAEQLEDIFNIQTCVQTIISLMEMCFSLYLLSKQFDIDAGNELTYLCSTSFELFMYCWFGNKITEASTELKYSLYESDWLSTSEKYKKQMLITMTRLNSPIYITIGKITPLTFNTFLTMVRGAYSFFTFLKQREKLSTIK